MGSTGDRSTREITNSRLKLADDLIFSPQVHGRNIYYHVEAPSRGSFYRIGYPEYVLISLLDGQLTVAQALTITSRGLQTKALTQAQGVQVATWLLENGLAEFAERDDARGASAAGPSEKRAGLLQRLNPFWMKLSLGSPDRILAALTPALGWLFSPWATLLGLAVIVFGASCLLTQWEAFASSAASVLAPHNWLWLGLAWIGLKIAHELAHGLACRYYRGEVREVGVVFILFAPMAYVDVTSCWRFVSKWQRIHVAAAGIYVELLLASVAAIVWTRVDSSTAHYLLHNVILMASLSTLLFNANPLLKFDGYYILADLLEIPNLATEGSQFVNQFAARVFYGTRMQSQRLVGFRLWCVRGYGIASAAWRLLICFSLATAASVLMHGAGLLLALGGLAVWWGRPVWNLALDLLGKFHKARSSFVRAISIGSAVAAAGTLALTQIPWPGVMTAPAIAEYADLAVVRSRAAGFVERVHVDDGERVAVGQLLMQLRNEDLEAERRELELDFERKQVLQRIALDKQDAAGGQIAERNLRAVSERLDEVRRRADGLQVFAPIDGRVLGRNLRQKIGSYVREGAEVLGIGDERNKELLISVGQQEVDAVLPLVGQPATFRVGGRMIRSGTLQRLEPRASTELPHPAMNSAVGGPLAVTTGDAAQPTRVRLTEPRFRGVISLAPAASRDLGAGEQGYARLGLRRESIGEFVWVRFSGWLEALLTPVRK